MDSAHKPILIVIAGPNGSGKTTITSRLLKSEWLEDAVYINPDNVAQEKFGDWNSPEAVINAAQYCEGWREKCLSEKRILNKMIILINTPTDSQLVGFYFA